ncbi:hypothetical protein BH683_010865 [Williamsia sp. 1138]|uniref:lipopolysaccharide biosynthesis protein n=1 Tax=Williamsia sp. 1138 TaxID=1903117 RepID=UPI000A0FEA9C|nr:lipopolysaccharide biosynthesis protein [Williamsia sp. 1138]OZG29160.1 hypothetical protein BH683_010865 [Williamsia sp. 1138]
MTATDVRGVAGQAGYIAGGRLIGALIQAVCLALVARSLGPADFGLFAMWYGLAVVLQACLNMGLTPLLVRIRAVGGRDADVLRILTISRHALFVFSSSVTLVAVLAASLLGAEWYLVALVVWVAADNLVEIYLAIPLADGRAWENAMSLVFRRSISGAILLVGLWSNSSSALFYSAGLAIGSTLVLYPVMRSGNSRLRESQSALTYRQLFSEARYFWYNSLATQARNVDVFVVSLLATGSSAGATTGYYAAASRLTSPLRIVPTSFASVLMPAAVRSAKAGSYRGIVRATLLICVVSSLGFLIVAVLAPIALPFILGSEYADAASTIQIVCVGLVFASVSSQLNAVLQALGHARLVSNVSVVSTAMCLLLVAALVPIGGAVGAGWGLTISYFLQSIILAFGTVHVIRRTKK